MTNTRTSIRKKRKKTKYRLNFKRIIIVLVALALIIGAIVLATNFLRPIFEVRKYKKVYEKRYSDGNLYVQKLSQSNENYFYDETVFENGRYARLTEPKLNNKLEITLDKILYNKIVDYSVEKKLLLDDISISIINMDKGDRFNFNANKSRKFENTDKLMLSMVYSDLISKGKINPKTTYSLKKEDLMENSYFFKEDNIGLTYELQELLKLSFNNEDITARNMLKRYLIDLYDTNYPEIVRRELGLYFDVTTNTNTILNLSRKMYHNTEVYSEILYNMDAEKQDEGYLNYISRNNTMNYIDTQIENFYDFGFIKGDINYIYAISTKDIPIENIREMADLLDRVISEYYILKSL